MARKQEVFGVTIDGDITGLKKAMNEAVKEFNSTERALKNVEKALKLDPNNVDLLKKRTALYKKEVQEADKALEELYKDRDKILNDVNFAKGIDEEREKYTELILKIEEMEAKRKKAYENLNNLPSPNTQIFINKMNTVSKSLDDIAQKTRALSGAFSAIGIASLKSSIDYESNIANIRRVVSDLSDETIQDLKDIAVETGNTFEDISEYATIAGALGLAENEIAEFARTMTDLNTATGGAFSGEEGAKGIAVFLKQLNLGIEQARNFGSAVAVVGDKYADIGDETVRVATRLSGLNSIIDTNQYELIGLAAVMSDLGLSADTNSNGINRAFLQLDKIINGGAKNATAKLQEMASVAGMTSDEFKQAWGTNAMEAFLRFTDGLKSSVFNEINTAINTSDEAVMKFSDTLGWSADQFKQAWGENSRDVFDKYIESLDELGDDGAVASKVLGDLGIASVNTAQTMLRLAGNGNEVREAISLVTQAWNENTALTEKSNGIYDTTARKLKGLWESIKQLGASLGDEVLPYLKDGIDDITQLTREFSKLDPNVKKIIIKLIALGSAISPVAKGVSSFASGVSTLLTFMGGTGGLVATLGLFTVAGIQAMGMIETSSTKVGELKLQSQGLNEELNKSIELSDSNYLSKIKEIESVNKYASSIEDLVKQLQDENKTSEDKAQIKQELTGYIESLNSALGYEAIYFDETTGKIMSQGEEVSNLKDKVNELSTAFKKEAWLETHKEVLSEAYDVLGQAEELSKKAVEDYSAKAIPTDIANAIKDLTSNATSLDDLKISASELRDYLIEIGKTDIAVNFDLQEYANIWNNYQTAIQDTQTTINNANEVIKNYELVAEGNADNINTRIQNANESISIMNGGVGEAKKTLDELVLEREAYASALTEEQKQNDALLKTYDDQIARKEYENEIGIHMFEMDKERRKAWEEWQPQPKYQEIILQARNLESFYGGGTRNGGSGGFGFESAGFNDIFSKLQRSISKTVSSPIMSGGYNSGGVTLNANFTVNSNNVTNADVRSWAMQMVDVINDELGRAI